MHSVARRAVAGLVVVFLGATLWVTVGAAGPPTDDPRNASDDYYDAVNGGKCAAHHEEDGFDPMRVGFVERYSEVPVGQDTELVMRVRQASGIGQAVQNIAVHLDLTHAPNVVALTEDFVEDLSWTNSSVVSSGGTFRVPFPVEPGARHVKVVARTTGEELLAPYGLADGELEMTLHTDAEREIPSGGGRLQRTIDREGHAARDLGTGDFAVVVGWSSSVDDQMPVEVVIEVAYERSASVYTFRPPAGTVLRHGDHVDVPIPVRFTGPGGATLDFRVESVSYWTHLKTSNAPRDDGLFYRFVALEVLGGERVVKTESAVGPVPFTPSVDLYNLFTRLVGFVTLVLIPAALVTGGVFGRGSRRWLNRVTGGAKRRVLWHMAMSWGIIVLATAHLLLALVESQFLWTKGIFWGGVAWVLLITLGGTGYLQARIIKGWGYRAWRHVHLWPAVGVFVFGLAHAVLDGSDLTALRDLLPGADRLVWP